MPNGSLAETYKSSRRRKGGEFHSDPGDARIFSAYIFPETVWPEGNVRKRAICLFCDGPGIECGKNKSGSDGGAKTVENPVTDAGGKFHPDMGRDKTTGNTNGWKEIFISIWDDACGKKKRGRARGGPGAGSAVRKLYGEEKSDSVEEIRIQNDNLLAVHCDDALFLHAGQLSGESAAIRVEKARELGFREREFPDAVFLLGQGREVEL